MHMVFGGEFDLLSQYALLSILFLAFFFFFFFYLLGLEEATISGEISDWTEFQAGAVSLSTNYIGSRD